MTDNKDIPIEKYSLPKDSHKYDGEYIVFFSKEKMPQVLFHSLSPSASYRAAENIQGKFNKIPTVLRITRDKQEVSHLFFHSI